MGHTSRSRLRSPPRPAGPGWARLRLWSVVAPLVAAAGVSASVPAAGQMLNVRSYAVADGLPQVQVMALHQDRWGYMWFGTYAGLTRYDGREFTTLDTDRGLTSNAVVEIVEMPRGGLAVGTIGGGVCFVTEGRARCLGVDEGLAHHDVVDLAYGPDDALWAATPSGLSRIVDGSVTAGYAAGDGLPDPSVLALAFDEQGRLWAGTEGGLARLEGDRFVPAGPAALRHADVQVLLSANGMMWGGGDGKLLRWTEDGAAEEVSLPGVPARTALTDLMVDRDGVVWLTTRAGVVRLGEDGARRYTTQQGLAATDVNRVIQDREGGVWFGTENGVSKLALGPMSLYTRNEGLPDPFVRALAEDGAGRLWAGTRGGVARWDGERFHHRPLGLLEGDPRVYAVAAAPGGGLLVGTAIGLFHLEGAATTRYGTDDGLPAEFVTSLEPDGDRGVWVGTAGGLVRWNSGRLEEVDDSLVAGEFIIALARSDEVLYLGRRRGGVVVHGPEGSRVVGGADGLSDQTVWDLAVTPDGGVWVGTNGEGAFHLGVDGHIRRISRQDGLVNDYVWQVLQDARGDTWFFTGYGLDRLRDGRIVHYGRGRGLSDLEGTASGGFQDRHGTLWFGAGSGVYRYEASLDLPPMMAPPVYVEALTAGEQELALRDARVPPNAGVLRVRFSSPSFVNEAATRFRWRLRGANARWSPPLEEGAVTLAGLAPGAYTLEVVAESNGLQSVAPALVSFHILPAWWQTWWFRGGLLLALIVPVSAVPMIRARRLERERRRLNELVAERTTELKDKNLRLQREVGEREAAESALRVSEERIRDILEHSTNLFYSRAASGVLTYVSPQATRFLGRTANGRIQWADLLSTNPDNQLAVESGRRALATGVRQPPYRMELRRPDGTTLWVEVNEAPVVRDGRAVAVVGAMADVTAAKQAAEERDRLQAQLLQSQKLEAVGRLAGGIAHDFNNLLTSVMGHAELASEGVAPDDPLGQDLAEIQRAGRRGAELVSQLLAFSRRQIVRCEVVDVGNAVREALRMIHRLIGADIDLVVDADGPAPVEVDPTQLDQVLMNLSVNARDAMPRGGRLEITVRRANPREALDAWGPDTVPPGAYVLLRVADEGVGMTEETMRHVFEPFFTTKRQGEGTGLGLATVYGVVRQHHGFVQVTSHPDRGTSFYVYFPVADAGIGRGAGDVAAHASPPAQLGLTPGSSNGHAGFVA